MKWPHPQLNSRQSGGPLLVPTCVGSKPHFRGRLCEVSRPGVSLHRGAAFSVYSPHGSHGAQHHAEPRALPHTCVARTRRGLVTHNRARR